MTLCMVAASLAGNGVDRALLVTANSLAARSSDVTVLPFESVTSGAYSVPAGLSWGCTWRAGLVREPMVGCLKQPPSRNPAAPAQRGCLLSNLDEHHLLAGIARTGRPVVATEHNIATLDDAPMRAVWRTLRRLVYPWMVQVVIVKQRLALRYAWLQSDKLRLNLPANRGTGSETFNFLSDDVRCIVGIGRLAPEKGFDRLIRAFHLVEKDCRGLKLLVGEDPLRADLTRLVASLGLEGRVVVPGQVDNPRTLLPWCALFALSSESEGFSFGARRSDVHESAGG